MEIRIEKAELNNLEEIREIASNYPEDFESYIPKFPVMIIKERVYVIKRNGKILAFATFGVSKKDTSECFTSSARSPSVKRKELSGDLMKSLFEEILIQKGFRKFTAHVRYENTNAIKMMIRNGYKRVKTTTLLNKEKWLEFCKLISV